MHRFLPNTTAEAFGFTIPARSSSLRDHSMQASKHRTKSSIDKSQNEVEQLLRSVSLGSREASIRRGTFLESPSSTPRQTLDRASSSSGSTVSSNAPLSLYRTRNKPAAQPTDELLRQASLRIKTFPPTEVPDPRNSPDIRTHPSNSLPETPVNQLPESPIIPLLDAYPLNRTSETQCGYPSQPSTNPTTPVSVPASPPSQQTEGTTTASNLASAVLQETTPHHTENMILEQITRNMHYRDSQDHIQPTKEMVYAPAQHFAAGIEGKVIKIPDALGETLEMVKERGAEMGIKNMGWE